MISQLRSLWKNLFRRKQLNSDLDEELNAYMELVAVEKLRSGMSPEETGRNVRREVAGVEQARQGVRDIRAGVSLERLAQDVRYGVRALRKNPAFTVVSVATLALGIGANTAMFSLLDQIVLRLLPVKQPERLVKVTIAGNNFGNTYGTDRISWPMFEDLRDKNKVFSGMLCSFLTTVTVGTENAQRRPARNWFRARISRYLGSRRSWAASSLPMTTRSPTASRLWCSATASGGTTLTRTARLWAGQLR